MATVIFCIISPAAYSAVGDIIPPPQTIVLSDEDKTVADQEIEMPFYNIPLNKEFQRFLFNKSLENKLSYELVLAIAYTESRFNPEASSTTNDRGLFQINKGTHKWIEGQLGKKLHPFNAYENAEGAIWYLSYLASYWREQGHSEEETLSLTVMSYNRGIAGATDFVEKYGFDNKYLSQVLDYKSKLERGELK